ncbi:hypothetical protein [Microseira wollei]|uniref:hypothetical protein n=1 Tax=Microseira wollei TaxID=467598 RepID=UPI001CFF1FA3|nr:hypothetical protein [Microseira wollei]
MKEIYAETRFLFLAAVYYISAITLVGWAFCPPLRVVSKEVYWLPINPSVSVVSSANTCFKEIFLLRSGCCCTGCFASP